MKYIMILLCLGLCYVSLPVTSVRLANGQATESAATPAAVEETEKDSADTKKSVETDATKSDFKPVEEADSDVEADKKDADAAKSKTDEKPAGAKAEKKKGRKTAKAETKRVKVVVTLDGTFTAEKMTPVALRPESWSQFEIVEVVDHGSEVHEGQTLIKFDSEKLDEELADLELGMHLSELAIRKAEQELPRLEKSLAMAAEAAERNDKNAREDYDRYLKVERPMVLKSVDYSLKGAQFSLDYAQDELNQLEKMYEADDLTEETEEIVLKRSRTEVDFAKFYLEQAKQYADTILNVRLPRADIALEESLDKASLDLARAKTALALDLTRERYELEQQKKSRAKALDRHADLLADRALMELKAPADGIVYYGECEDGDWSDLASLIRKLKPHGSVSGDTVVMTIVERRPLMVLAQVEEAKRPELSVGQPASVVPPVENAAWLPARISKLTSIPVASGKFDAQFDLTDTDLPDWIVAGMSCKVKVTTYDKAEALVVPKKAVQTDKFDEQQKYVWLVDPEKPEAKAERRDVKLGKTSGDDVEILKGLESSDVVSLEDEDKADADQAKE